MIRILSKDGQLLAEIEADSLRNAMLANKYLKGAELAGRDLTGANLDDADLSNANLEGAKLEDASLVKTKLNEANLSHAKLKGARFHEADFTKANLERASAQGASFIGTNLSHVWAKDSDFSNASLASSAEQPFFLMNNADFSGATFDDAQILGADVSFTCFFGTDFSKAAIGLKCRSHRDGDESQLRYFPQGFGFTESKYNPFFDNSTRWPDATKFPPANLPWLLITKYAGIAYFWFSMVLCAFAYFAGDWIHPFILNATLLVVVAAICIAGCFVWFFNRTKKINNEIETEPSLHYGRYVGMRSEYHLGLPMTDDEKRECLSYR